MFFSLNFQAVCGLARMAGSFDDDDAAAEQTVSIQEYLKDVEEQELVLPFYVLYFLLSIALELFRGQMLF